MQEKELLKSSLLGMFKFTLFFTLSFLIYTINFKMSAIKKFKEFTNESFIDNGFFGKLGSILGGEKSYSVVSSSPSSIEDEDSKSTSFQSGSRGNKVKLSQGILEINTNKSAPLVVVFGGTDVGGKASGVYMYNYFTSDLFSKYTVFIANSSRIDGNKAWKEIIDKCQELGLTPSKKILYLFSGGYLPAMQIDKNSDVNKRVDYLNSAFNKIFLVDIWIGTGGSNFYQKLAEKYGNKLEYYSYGGSGSAGGSANSAVRKIIVSKSSKSYLNSPDHMKTNLEAIKSLKSQF
jgi:hypothetical protein